MNREIEFRCWDNDSCEMVYNIGIDPNGIAYTSTPDVYDSIFYPDSKIMQFTGWLDKNGVKIFDGDLLFCEKAKEYLSGDGYLKKKYPKVISAYLQVIFEYGGFEFKYLRAIDEHLKADQEIHYRCHKYGKNPLYVGVKRYDPKTNDWTIEGDGKTCHDVEVIGNIFQNHELLEEK